MKYFPPQGMVKQWISSGALQPNPVDQPMAMVNARGYKLSEVEKERALYLLTNADVPFREFQELPEVKQAMNCISIADKKNN